MRTLKLLSFVFILFLCGLWGTPGHALIIDPTDTFGDDYFLDTNTGLVWMDLDTFSGQAYGDVETGLDGSGFHIADIFEVAELFLSLDQQPIEEIFDIIGYTYLHDFSNPLVGLVNFQQASIGMLNDELDGLINDGNPGYAYVEWFYLELAGTVIMDDSYYYEYVTQLPANWADPSEVGVWVVQDTGNTGGQNPVPEPGTVLLLGIGAAGLALYRRKRKI